MYFQDDIFQIEPISGKIWPNTEITCCVTFRPLAPLKYSCTSYCNITCQEDRLELELSGEGIGPKAKLDKEEWDLGDIFVTAVVEKEFIIENKGKIECHFALEPVDTPFGKSFKFDCDHGILAIDGPGRSKTIKATFHSKNIGEFTETFKWKLMGSEKELTLTYRGHVISPTFKFSEEEIDFGPVSYNFKVQKPVKLTNTSDVPIHYVLDVPQDNGSFKIEPSRGTIHEKGEQNIIVIYSIF